MRIRISVTKINIVENCQRDLTYYIVNLYANDELMDTQCLTSFKEVTNNIDSIVELASFMCSSTFFQQNFLRFCKINNLIDFDFSNNVSDKYTDDYGKFKLIS